MKISNLLCYYGAKHMPSKTHVRALTRNMFEQTDSLCHNPAHNSFTCIVPSRHNNVNLHAREREREIGWPGGYALQCAELRKRSHTAIQSNGCQLDS
eukprot:6149212-Amphidinium_carterae.2